MITRQDGFPSTYLKYPAPGVWLGHSGRASWDFRAGPVYELHRWAGPLLTPGGIGYLERVAMDPSDPSTWRRPYVFTS